MNQIFLLIKWKNREILSHFSVGARKRARKRIKKRARISKEGIIVGLKRCLFQTFSHNPPTVILDTPRKF